jgi:hypothetical protein
MTPDVRFTPSTATLSSRLKLASTLSGMAISAFIAFMLFGCNEPWTQPNLAPEQRNTTSMVHLPETSHLLLLHIDGLRVGTYPDSSKYSNFVLTPGKHTAGFVYSKRFYTYEMHETQINETRSTEMFQISFTLKAGEEYEAVAIVDGDTWVPAIRHVKSNRIVSKPSSRTYS